MTSLQYLDLVLKVLTLGGVIFAVYLYFRKPQEQSVLNDAETKGEIDKMKSCYDIQFINLEKLVTNLRDNHVHTLEQKLDQHISENQMYMLESTRSSTRMETLLEQLLKK